MRGSIPLSQCDSSTAFTISVGSAPESDEVSRSPRRAREAACRRHSPAPGTRGRTLPVTTTRPPSARARAPPACLGPNSTAGCSARTFWFAPVHRPHAGPGCDHRPRRRRRLFAHVGLPTEPPTVAPARPAPGPPLERRPRPSRRPRRPTTPRRRPHFVSVPACASSWTATGSPPATNARSCTFCSDRLGTSVQTIKLATGSACSAARAPTLTQRLTVAWHVLADLVEGAVALVALDLLTVLAVGLALGRIVLQPAAHGASPLGSSRRQPLAVTSRYSSM
jgi:hypothetical protein